MSHPAQQAYCQRVKKKFPQYFANVKVLDVGSLDINGCNKPLFADSEYLGLDLAAGRNVDIISTGHAYEGQNESFDVICSTECFEHDQFYAKTLKNIVRMLKPKGLFFFTCATTGRHVHGTSKNSPSSSPFTSSIVGWSDYYKNLEEKDIRVALNIEEIFSEFQFTTDKVACDIYFWGIKK